jgi:hypothetical protein
VQNPEAAAKMFMQQVPESDAKLVRASAEFLAKEYTKKIPYWGYQDTKKFDAYRIWANQQKIHNLNEDAQLFVSNAFLPTNVKSGQSK